MVRENQRKDSMALGLQHFDMFKQTAADVGDEKNDKTKSKSDSKKDWDLSPFPECSLALGIAQCKDARFPFLKRTIKCTVERCTVHEAAIKPHVGPS